MKRAVATLTLGAALLLVAPANATPNFPGAVQRTLGAVAAPACSLCHLCGITGRGTVNTSWGAAVRARGLQAYDEASLGRALAAMERDAIDSDGDGEIDVEAVRAGNDPNPAVTCEDGTIPKYGCVGKQARISPIGPRGGLFVLVGAALAAAAFARRRVGYARWIAFFLCVLLGSGLAACSSGASLVPRPEDPRRATPPAMPKVTPSRMSDELRAIGLDPNALPAFEDLSPRQLRRVMSTFTRSLGFACTDCHDADDHRAPTRAKSITIGMWNELTRGYGIDGGSVYCDSCHQGAARTLDRGVKKTLATYMRENFVQPLRRLDAKPMGCDACHGRPFRPDIVSKWGSP